MKRRTWVDSVIDGIRNSNQQIIFIEQMLIMIYLFCILIFGMLLFFAFVGLK